MKRKENPNVIGQHRIKSTEQIVKEARAIAKTLKPANDRVVYDLKR